jgi:nicotinamidase-related amidase
MKVEVPEYDVAEALAVDPARAVLLVVDMQNDFASEGGALFNPAAAATIPVIAELARRARAAGVPVWYTRDTHYPGSPEWSIWGRHAEHRSPGWEIVPALAPEPGDRVFEKTRYDGFYGTGLDQALRVHGRECLVIAGTVANICVHYTAASAGLRFYDVVVPVEGVSALTEFDLHATFRQISWLFGGRLVHADGLRFAAGS